MGKQRILFVKEWISLQNMRKAIKDISKKREIIQKCLDDEKEIPVELIQDLDFFPLYNKSLIILKAKLYDHIKQHLYTRRKESSYNTA